MNDENLIQNSERTPSERRENARKAGIASGAARRRKRDMKAHLTELSKMAVPESLKSKFAKSGMDVPEDMTYYDALAYSMMMEGIKGNTRAISLMFEVMGERQSDKMREKEVKLKEEELKQGKTEALDKLDQILTSITENAYADDIKAE